VPGRIVTWATTGEEANSIAIKGTETANTLVKFNDINSF
jgi:hypothetical protein